MPDYVAWDKIQQRAKSRIWAGFRDVDVLAATAPTGFGKTRLGAMLIRDIEAKGYSWVWYTHRKTLTAQTSASFTTQGLDFGVRASGRKAELELGNCGQIAMLQSERAAVKSGSRDLHQAKFVIVDEAHANANGYAETVIRHHVEDGAKVLLLTATPIGLGHVAQKLVTLATLSEMRDIGALLPAICYSPSEVSMKDVQKISSGDFSPTQQAKRFMQQQVVGDVITHFQNLNGQRLPSLGFAPCVKSSMWFVDEFIKRGIPAAHIDGEDVYLGERNWDGTQKVYPSSQKMREVVFEQLRSGEVAIIWNRFVMREGIDIPQLGHVVFACAFGAPETWIQACGRVLRADPDKPELKTVKIQDHGANCHRAGLGSPNQDREWVLDCTNKSIADHHKAERKEGNEEASVRCPGCFMEIARQTWISNGCSCPKCGASFQAEVRKVFQTDGKLVQVRQKSEKKKNQTHAFQKEWTKLYFQMKSPRARGSTFNYLTHVFETNCPAFKVNKKTGRVRNIDTGETFKLGFCPTHESDWDCSVKIVPNNRLQWPEKF
jgi:DNA repair protein RadD